MDIEYLLAGQHWNQEIEKALQSADTIVICLSKSAIIKEGYIQKEIKMALEVAEKKPSDTIFIIPLRLDDCEVPYELRHLQYQDYKKGWYKKLLQS